MLAGAGAAGRPPGAVGDARVVPGAGSPAVRGAARLCKELRGRALQVRAGAGACVLRARRKHACVCLLRRLLHAAGVSMPASACSHAATTAAAAGVCTRCVRCGCTTRLQQGPAPHAAWRSSCGAARSLCCRWTRTCGAPPPAAVTAACCRVPLPPPAPCSFAVHRCHWRCSNRSAHVVLLLLLLQFCGRLG